MANDVNEVEKLVADRSAGCQSIAASFSVDADTLQTIVGRNFTPQVNVSQKSGSLTIEVLSCASDTTVAGKPASVATARTLIDLDESKAPIMIAGSDSWDSYALHIGDEASALARFMGSIGVATVSGRSVVSSFGTDDSLEVLGTVGFEGGEVRISMLDKCAKTVFGQHRVLAGTGSERFSLLSGTESGYQCQAQNRMVRIEGQTPFSDLNLDTAAATVIYRTDLAWDLTVWRGANLGLR